MIIVICLIVKQSSHAASKSIILTTPLTRTAQQACHIRVVTADLSLHFFKFSRPNHNFSLTVRLIVFSRVKTNFSLSCTNARRDAYRLRITQPLRRQKKLISIRKRRVATDPFTHLRHELIFKKYSSPFYASLYKPFSDKLVILGRLVRNPFVE